MNQTSSETIQNSINIGSNRLPAIFGVYFNKKIRNILKSGLKPLKAAESGRKRQKAAVVLPQTQSLAIKHLSPKINIKPKQSAYFIIFYHQKKIPLLLPNL